MTAPRIGFVGLGRIGRPMAERLVAAGLDPVAFDVSTDALGSIAARAAATPRDLAGQCDVIGVCVPADAELRDVLTGVDGLLAGAASGAVIAVHSTVRPDTILALARDAEEQGVDLIEACISGGEVGAGDGTLVIMAGGSSDAIDRSRSMLDALAKMIVHTGPLGTATRVKLCNNVMTYVALQGVFEAWQLALAAGIPADMLKTITKASGVLSDRMERFLTGLQLPDDIAATPAVQAMLDHYARVAAKDLTIALDLADTLGAAVPASRLSAAEVPRVFRASAALTRT